MFKQTKEKIQNFKQTAATITWCQRGYMSDIVKDFPYALIFKTTNWCWNNCAHCCEFSGPNMPKQFIPDSIINSYIDQAIKDKQFIREIVFTGGEITSAYKFAGKNYISNIINHALDTDCGVDIKTNAAWVNSSLANQFYYDIENAIRNHSINDNESGIKHISKLQISLSLDSFHRDAMERNLKFIEHFANTNIPGVAFLIHVSSIYQDKNLFPDLMHKLSCSGVTVNDLYMVSRNTDNAETVYDLNNNVIIRHSCGTLFNGGRAKDIKYAQCESFPQFTFVDSSGTVLTAFDSFGNVTLGENNGEKITTPWRDAETKQPIPLKTIRDDLVVATKDAEQKVLQQHQKMAAYLSGVAMFTNFINQHDMK